MDQNQLEQMAMQFVQAYYGALSTNVESIQNFYVGETSRIRSRRQIDALRSPASALLVLGRKREGCGAARVLSRRIANQSRGLPVLSPPSCAGHVAQHDQSMLTFEGDKMQGKARIMDKFRSAASIGYSGEGMTVDVMPGVDQNAFIIVIVGKLFIDGDKPLNFSETFQLVRHGGGESYVHNQIRRLVYG